MPGKLVVKDPRPIGPGFFCIRAVPTKGVAVNAKDKILRALQTDLDNAEREIKRWGRVHSRYVADMILDSDAGRPVNLRTASSRSLAKEELDAARESRRLYRLAIAAVRKG